MRHVVMFSGGVGSWATARRVADAGHRPVLLCANTNTEADDWLTFVAAACVDVAGDLVMVNNGGRNIWDVFREEHFIGNTRADICSRVLKREPLRQALADGFDPSDTVVYLGFDWTEQHRLDRARPHWEPWTVAAPLCDPPYRSKGELLDELKARGLPVPRLYEQGFSHNNCAGGCVKAGQVEWRRLLLADRDRYLWNEKHEEAFRAEVGKDVAILRDRRDGETQPLTLRDFRMAIETDPQGGLFDPSDYGSCSCMETSA